MYQYKTKGTCSQMIYFDVEENKVKNVQFIGGCNGNLKGIAALVEGMDIDDVIARVEGVKCGMKSTEGSKGKCIIAIPTACCKTSCGDSFYLKYAVISSTKSK